MTDKKKQMKRILILLFVLEFLLVAVFIGKILHASASVGPFAADFSGKMDHTENGYRLPDGSKIDPEDDIVLTAVYSNIQNGTYLATVFYETDEIQTVAISSSQDRYLKVNPVYLNPHELETSFVITVTQPVEEITLEFHYSGNGQFLISDTALSFSRVGFIKTLLLIIVLFSLAELAVWGSQSKPQQFRTILILAVIAAISFLPYLSSGIVTGHDFDFHYMRIEGMTDALASGQFPVYMQPLWMHGYGSPVSLYYGDILLYFPAVLRLIGFSFNSAYKTFVFLITFATAGVAYLSFGRMGKSKNTALLMTFAYVCAPYRLVDIYVRNAIGEYCAFLFLPLVAAGIFGILSYEPGGDRKSLGIDGSLTAIGLAGVLYSHILSMEMTVFMLFVVLLITIRLWLQKDKLRTPVLSAVFTLLLCLGFLIPFLDSYRNNSIEIKDKVESAGIAIQDHGAQIGELFAPFKSVFGMGDAEHMLTDRMYLSIGMVLLLALIAALILGLKRRLKRQTWLYLAMAGLSLFLSTNLFPYDFLSGHFKLGNLFAQVQFPWRYLMFATFFAVLVLGDLLSECRSIVNKKTFQICCYVLMTAVFIETLGFVSNYLTGSTQERIIIYNRDDVKTDRDSAEYLRTGTNTSAFTYLPLTENAEVQVIPNGKTIYSLYCKTGEEEGAVIVPVLYYKGYRVRDEYGKEYEIGNGWNNQIVFIVPPGFEGRIDVTFEPPRYWTLSKWISLICLVFLAVRMIRQKPVRSRK